MWGGRRLVSSDGVSSRFCARVFFPAQWPVFCPDLPILGQKSQNRGHTNSLFLGQVLHSIFGPALAQPFEIRDAFGLLH